MCVDGRSDEDQVGYWVPWDGGGGKGSVWLGPSVVEGDRDGASVAVSYDADYVPSSPNVFSSSSSSSFLFFFSQLQQDVLQQIFQLVDEHLGGVPHPTVALSRGVDPSPSVFRIPVSVIIVPKRGIPLPYEFVREFLVVFQGVSQSVDQDDDSSAVVRVRRRSRGGGGGWYDGVMSYVW